MRPIQGSRERRSRSVFEPMTMTCFPQRNQLRRHALLALLAPLALGSCQKSDSGPFEITEVRELRPEHAFEQPVLTKDSATRFGYSERRASPEEDAGPSLVWDVPEGWKEMAKTGMRDANLRFGPNDEGECYLTRLPGGAGGLAANVNRWRKQMGQDPIDESAVANLPKQPLFGQDAVLVDLEGDFTGMGTDTKTNYRMRGLILDTGNGSLFVKMTGPRDLVTSNIDAFNAFCQSLTVSVPTP